MVALIFQKGLESMTVEANGKGRPLVPEKAVRGVPFDILLLGIVFGQRVPLMGLVAGSTGYKSGGGFVSLFVIKGIIDIDPGSRQLLLFHDFSCIDE